MLRRTVPLPLLLTLALAACGGGGDDGSPTTGPTSTGAAAQFEQSYSDVDAYPVFVSNELVLGPNRFVVGLLDSQDAPLADPKIKMEISFYDIAGDEPQKLVSEKMKWVWLADRTRGYYIGNVDFDRAGELGAEVKVSGAGIEEELRAKVGVSENSTTPPYGIRPPAVDTPTLAEADKLEEISTDTTPEPRFYKYSIAEALKRKAPSVIVFATPKFCQSAVCAPTLDTVQSVAKEFPQASFVHVEPYELAELPEELVPVEAMSAWNLPTEPWVFVMNRDGRVVGKYEGVVAPTELRDQLKSLT